MTEPAPSDQELDAAYGGWYRPAEGRFSGFGDWLLRRLRARPAVRIDRVAPPGPVLDVGSGEGALLAALRRRGREAVGLERNAAKQGIRAEDILEVEEEGWGAIVFWHSLEHLREPRMAIEHAARLLRDDGLLVVAVPNSASLQARIFGDRWFALDLPRHLVHLTAPALLSGISGTGMRVEQVSHHRGGQVVFGWLQGIVGTLPGHPDLYDAIRRPAARSVTISDGGRWRALAVAALALPLAVLAALVEILLRRGGTVYVEARRA
ncbi:MAG TPA: class I SAM-dependent methyltransferase [Solirubrobacterales bacterium]|nr:class I SAM-dependent methyltransferase [Solirubrobacterales bacterium]